MYSCGIIHTGPKLAAILSNREGQMNAAAAATSNPGAAIPSPEVHTYVHAFIPLYIKQLTIALKN